MDKMKELEAEFPYCGSIPKTTIVYLPASAKVSVYMVKMLLAESSLIGLNPEFITPLTE